MELSKERRCNTCANTTAQVLRPCSTGATWTCGACGATTATYTHADMQKLLAAASDALPRPTRLPSTEGVRVFIEGANAQEVELDGQFVKKHVELMGELPKVGGSVYTALPGIPGRLGAIPYGKVTRIECPAP